MSSPTDPSDPANRSLQQKLADLERRLAENERQLADAQRFAAEATRLAMELNTLIDASGDGVILFDLTGKPVRANAEAVRISGYDPAGSEWSEMARSLPLFRLDGSQVLPAELPSRRAMHGEHPEGEPYRLINARGQEFILLVSASPVVQESELVGVVATWRDITERKHAEEMLGRYRLLSAHTRDIILFLDRNNGRILEANLAAEKAYGFSREELLERSVQDLRAPNTRELTAEQMEQADLEGILFETYHLRKDGSIFPVEVSSRGATVGDRRTLISVVRDITERKRAATGLQRQIEVTQAINRVLTETLHRETDEQLGAICLAVVGELTQSVFGFIGEIGADGLLHDLAISETAWAACKMYDDSGQRRPPASFPIEGIYGRVLSDGKSLIANHPDIHPDRVGVPEGHPKLTAFLGVPLIDEGRTVGIVSVGNREGGYREEDQTALETLAPALVEAFKRLRAEQRLRQRERQHRELAEAMEVERAKLAAAIDNLPVGVGIGDSAGNTLSLNAAGLKLHGFLSEEEMFSRLDDYIHEFELRYLDGRVMPVEQWPASRAMRGEFVREYELVLHNRLTGDEKILSYSVAPVRNSTGEIVLITYVMQDMTERKHAEKALREGEATLREYAAKLERSNHDLQEFAYVASHDLQEPLRKIEVFGSSLQSAASRLNDRERDLLNRMQAAANRMRSMIEDLLTLSRVTTQGRPFLPVDLGEIVSEVVSDLEIRFRRTGGQVEIGPLPEVEADPLQMRQLFLNLILNSLKYIRPDAPPQIGITAEQTTGDAIEIRVQDNGIGFDESQVDQIFQPFKRLVSRSEYEGTGMGLAICRKIAERHNGSITAKSVIGEGSTFVITLPVKQVSAVKE